MTGVQTCALPILAQDRCLPYAATTVTHDSRCLLFLSLSVCRSVSLSLSPCFALTPFILVCLSLGWCLYQRSSFGSRGVHRVTVSAPSMLKKNTGPKIGNEGCNIRVHGNGLMLVSFLSFCYLQPYILIYFECFFVHCVKYYLIIGSKSGIFTWSPEEEE